MIDKKSIFKTEELRLFSAASCNLNCSYCYLHKNSFVKELDANICKAWENGEYVRNVEAVLKRLDVCPLNIIKCQFWGGETLLHTNVITPNIQSLCNILPNVYDWYLSTNWMIDVDEFINLLIEIDKNTKPHSVFRLQTSIDGYSENMLKYGHNGNWDTYYKNFEKLANFINNRRLINIDRFVISTKVTMTKEVYFDQFKDEQGILEYMKYMLDLNKYLVELFANKMVSINLGLPSLPHPKIHTTEDGIKLGAIARRWDSLSYRAYKNFQYDDIDDISILGSILFGMGAIGKQQNLLNTEPLCGQTWGSLAINYDGTISNCTANLLHSFEEYWSQMKNKNSFEYQTKKMYDRVTYNPLKMTDEELDDYIYYQILGLRKSNGIIASMLASEVYELALSGQIPLKYGLNRKENLRGCAIVNSTSRCNLQNIESCHDQFATPLGQIRLLLNGADCLLQDINSNRENTILGSID